MNMHNIIKGKFDQTGAMLDVVRIEHSEWLDRRDKQVKELADRFWTRIVEAADGYTDQVTEKDIKAYVKMLWRGLGR